MIEICTWNVNQMDFRPLLYRDGRCRRSDHGPGLQPERKPPLCIFPTKKSLTGEKIRQKKKLPQDSRELPVAIDEARIPGYNAEHTNHRRRLMPLDTHLNSPLSRISRDDLFSSSSPPVFLRIRSLQIR
jgi:hypothetical protein